MTAHDPRGLAGKVAVIAGGATGIGAATAARLGTEGVHVVVGDIAGEAAEATAQAIRGAGGAAAACAFDLADPESVRALIDSAVAGFGGVDLLFNVGSDMSLLRADTDVVDIDFEVWDRTMAVTLRGYLASMKHALPLMLSRGGGAIVNMSSAAAFIGEPTRPAYATAKAGIGGTDAAIDLPAFLGRPAPAKAAPSGEKPLADRKTAAKAEKPLGKRAAILAAAQAGILPTPPDFTAETHKRFRGKLADLVALAAAGDVAGLKAYAINPISSSPKALDRYRNLCVMALGAGRA